MTDYADLIEALTGRGLTSPSTLGAHSGLYDEAADAIMQLVREREALLKALSGNCYECKHFGTDDKELFCGKCFRGDGWENKWEWIGVDEE